MQLPEINHCFPPFRSTVGLKITAVLLSNVQGFVSASSSSLLHTSGIITHQNVYNVRRARYLTPTWNLLQIPFRSEITSENSSKCFQVCRILSISVLWRKFPFCPIHLRLNATLELFAQFLLLQFCGYQHRGSYVCKKKVASKWGQK